MHKLQGSVTRLTVACIIAVLTIPAFSETPISDPVSGRGASWQTAPDSATDGRDFLLVWADSRSGRSAIYATRVAADGSVLDPEGILVSNPAEGAFAPTVAWTGDSYIVVWQEQERCGFRRIATDGRISDRIGTVLDGQCRSPRAAALNGTTIVAAFLWHGVLAAEVIERTGAVRRINPVQGGGWFDIACTRSECRWVWNSNGLVMGRRLGPNGETLSDDRVLATDAMSPSIAATEDRFLLTWRDPSSFGVPSRRIWAQELDAETEPFLVAQTQKSAFLDVRVSRSGRGFMVAWIQERGDAPVEHRSGVRSDDVADHTAYVSPPGAQFEIRAQRIGDGEEEQQLIAPTNVALDQSPSIASNGVTHIGAWIERNSRKIAAAILDDGARSRIAVTRTAAAQSEPHVVHCGDHLLVVWAEELHGNGMRSILARRFQLSGDALDPRPIVIANADANRHRPVAAFDGNSYLVAWYGGSRVNARRIHRDGTPAADVLTLSENGSGGRPAVVGTDRGFAVLHGDGPQLILTRIGADSSLERTVIADSHGGYALGWTGSEVVAVWSRYDHRVHAVRMSSDGARLGPDVLVDFGNDSAESLSIACGATECIAAWSRFWEGVKTASIANGQAFLVFETILEVPYYRAQLDDRYHPTVVRTAGEFKVITYGRDGTLYTRSVRDRVVSDESAVSEPRVEAEDYAIAATGEGLVTVYSRSVSGPGYGGSRRLFLRSHPQ
jgi:hypothetical protein